MSFEYAGPDGFSFLGGGGVIFRNDLGWVMRLRANIFKLGPEDALNCWEAMKNEERVNVNIDNYTRGVL